MANGSWLILENAHLSKEILLEIDRLIESLDDPNSAMNLNDSFKLFICS